MPNVPELKQARRYLVRGRVQGVGFRWFVQQSASNIGVSGYTRNLDNGQVEVYAIGTPSQLSDLAAALWKGPRMADVRGIDEQEAAPQKVSGFRIAD